VASLASASEKASPDADLSRVESSLQKEKKRHQLLKQKADALARDVRTVKAKMVKAAANAQKRERELTLLERRLSKLQGQEAALKQVIDHRGDQMVTVIAALQRLAWRPTEALIAQPTPPSDTVRSAILLRTAVPQIEADARELKTDLDKLSIVQAQVQSQKDRISTVAADLQDSQREMKKLFVRKAAIQEKTTRETRKAARRMQKLAEQASSLKDLIARIEAERKRQKELARLRAIEAAKRKRAEEIAEAKRLAAEKKAHEEKIARLKKEKKEAEIREALRKEQQRLAHIKKVKAQKAAAAKKEAEEKRQQQLAEANTPPPQSFSKARGRLPMPAIGKLATAYGQKTNAGVRAKGISILTRAEAQVITPFDGVVLFSGPFRGYGQLLIIEYGDGYHILLAGMSRIDATTGQSLLAGEPVGVMTNVSSPELYVELRHNGQPINPLPWLSASQSTNKRS